MSKAKKPIEITVVADQVEEDSETSEWVTRLEEAADDEIASGTVTLRWGRGQIALVKRAAGLLGVPYQTYLKQVVFRQALVDIEQIESVMDRPQLPAGAASRRPRRRDK